MSNIYSPAIPKQRSRSFGLGGTVNTGNNKYWVTKSLFLLTVNHQKIVYLSQTAVYYLQQTC